MKRVLLICTALVAGPAFGQSADSGNAAAIAAAQKMGQIEQATPTHKPFKPICFVPTGIETILTHDYRQVPVARGTDSDGIQWAIWSDKLGNFAVVVNPTDSLSCIEAMGNSLKVAAQPK